MGSEYQGAMLPAERTGLPQRIKDTCDMCSASKVKCNKKKPICSRCGRLDYPCFYSPARRIRKHQLDENSQAPSAGQQQQRQRQQPPEPFSISAMGDESATSSSASDDFSFGRDSNEPHSLPVQNIFSSSFPMFDANIPSLTTTNQGVTSAKRLRSRPTSSASECQQGPIPQDQKNDCVTTAIDLLQSLDRTSLKSFSTCTSPNAVGTTTLELVIKEASVAIQRTSVILVCPCSRKPDIGLLAAGVCSALLDIYQTALPPNAARSGSNHHPASLANTRTGQRSAASRFNERTPNGSINVPNREASTNYSGVDAKAPIMLILGELPKITDLVTQFRNRYSQNDDEEEDPSSRDMLRALVASMTSRLKRMIDEFTHLLVSF